MNELARYINEEARRIPGKRRVVFSLSRTRGGDALQVESCFAKSCGLHPLSQTTALVEASLATRATRTWASLCVRPPSLESERFLRLWPDPAKGSRHFLAAPCSCKKCPPSSKRRHHFPDVFPSPCLPSHHVSASAHIHAPHPSSTASVHSLSSFSLSLSLPLLSPLTLPHVSNPLWSLQFVSSGVVLTNISKTSLLLRDLQTKNPGEVLTSFCPSVESVRTPTTLERSRAKEEEQARQAPSLFSSKTRARLLARILHGLDACEAVELWTGGEVRDSDLLTTCEAVQLACEELGGHRVDSVLLGQRHGRRHRKHIATVVCPDDIPFGGSEAANLYGQKGLITCVLRLLSRSKRRRHLG